ncbi:RNA polymerase sigma factor [Ferrimicrobium sp.]|uniref:RNA polymerase sigma factor n=1 Tax=Ferrimicrobium sp. TaxID=2926050 RepID=UPI00344ED515
MNSEDVKRAVDVAFHEEWARIVATLIRRTGDWDLAEECAQEAFAEALRSWSVSGVPQRPGAWLTTVAGNRAIDRLRRATRGVELVQQVALASLQPGVEEEAMLELFQETDTVTDDRLQLMFTCCHPALPLEGRVALTLRSLAGLSTAEIARAFLVSEATMAKRLTRAKAKIRAAAIPFRVPPAHLLGERTAGVLAVLYLMFNEGYSVSEIDHTNLCGEAIRLTRALRQLMPDEPEVTGALALMILQHSRRGARFGADGELITLEEQDRDLWQGVEIREGIELLDSALRCRRVGPYQLQAAIAACHSRSETSADTDWDEISGLYGLLDKVMPSPVVRLNRAVAVAMTGNIEKALAIIDELTDQGELERYYLLEATRADLLRRLGNQMSAAAAYAKACTLAPSEVERRYLRRRLAEITTSAGGE